MTRHPNVCLIGNYPPRNCGIATFTSDLCQALAENGCTNYEIVAMNNLPAGYGYPKEVGFGIYQEEMQDYVRAAEYINSSGFDIVCLQHEFGIFGGPAGRHISLLLERLASPVVTTLHTIMAHPPPDYRESMNRIVNHSDRLVVLSEMGGRILKDVYQVPATKIEFIHHGIPDVPFIDPGHYKKQFNANRGTTILTFGLISPNKGIETMIQALPPVVERHPDVMYTVLGATHPEVRKRYGESYRAALEKSVRELGLQKNVIFHNRFVSLRELCDFILASDIYVTPYLSREQIVSGTLAYAVGMGKAVVSTPYWYAREVLANGRGILFDFGDTGALTCALLDLVGNPARRNKMRLRAYNLGREMIWKNVGKNYIDLFVRMSKPEPARGATPDKRTFVIGRNPTESERIAPGLLPVLNLNHLYLLSDDVGVVQHTVYGIPDRHHGYSTDDVGRGLVAVIGAYREDPQEGLLSLMRTYLSFLRYAQTKDGRFCNFMGYDRRFLESGTSEDTLGRAVWGIGYALAHGPFDGMRALAERMLAKARPHIENLQAPRAKAYAICGLQAVIRTGRDGGWEESAVIRLADDLAELYRKNRRRRWDWFEKTITYGNAKICQSLLEAYQLTNKEIHKEAALSTLRFLVDAQWNGQFFDLVGNDGWYTKGGEKALFGQQPIDAAYLAEALAKAYELTGTDRYLETARHAVNWFTGQNRLNTPLYDLATGAVADGLEHYGVSRNYGAESTICFILGLLSLIRAYAQTFPVVIRENLPEKELLTGS
ncbi:MAG: glycosyltransferase [Pseudomonadota bacterium]